MALPLNAEHLSRLGHLLDVALALEASERAAWLDTLGGHDSELQPVVAEILARAPALESEDFLGTLPKLFLEESASESGPGPGDVVGPYRLERELGRGGMGVVWLAERLDKTVKRKVALKLPHQGLGRAQLAQRFARERDILSALEHPNIARLYDAGVAEDGQPFLALEYVEGIPIDRYAIEHRLDIRQRLDLFVQVARAVAYAHANLVLHRDLKPSNILVTADGQVRLLDFGVAKLLQEGSAQETAITRFGGRAMTPDYASPEQISGRPLTTASDIYSLGVVLYELLTGQRPYKLKRDSLGALEEAILAADPVRPSRVVGEKTHRAPLKTELDDAVDAGNERDTDGGLLRRELRGDLDAITMKALEKDPGRRYGTPSELVTDIGRHLRNEPVLARPPSTAYRLRKYVRRHRLGVGVALGLGVLLLAFATTTAAQARRIAAQRDLANAERDRANREAAGAKRVTDFLTRMFNVSNPSEARGSVITAREILDRAATDLESGLDKDPELQARMMTTIGVVYERLGLLTRAQSLLEKALHVRRTTVGLDHPETLETACELGVVYMEQGRYPAAEKLMGDTLERKRHVLGNEDWRTLSEMGNLALVYFFEGRLADAEKLHREALEIERRRNGPDDPATLSSANNLAEVYLRANRLSEADELLRSTLTAKRRVLGPDHPSTLNTMINLGILLRMQRRFGESEQVLKDTLVALRQVLGPEHPRTLGTSNDLGGVLIQDGRVAEGERWLRDTLETERRALGAEHPATIEATVTLAGSYVRHGRLAEGERLLREAYETQRRLLGPDNPDLAWTRAELGLAALGRGQPDHALEILEDAFAHGLTPDFASVIGADPSWSSLRGNRRFAELLARPSEPATSR
jgi:eukaryotic-like serine/threonine-protein kinase